MDVGIIGATGYGGIELIRFLQKHPMINNIILYSSTQEGLTIDNLYPHLENESKFVLRSLQYDSVQDEVDTLFLATPPGVSAQSSEALIARGISVIDLSGDLRLKKQAIYEKWYGRTAAESDLLNESVYGLCEWNEEAIANARLIANPGCFPTAVLLGLAPLVKAGLIEMNSLIIDAKTGTSGAGKAASQVTHFSEMSENFKIYGVATHKHTPEIEQELERWHGQPVSVTFQPHLVPMVRGIMATMYATAKKPLETSDLHKLYQDAYQDHPFVRLGQVGAFPQTKQVYGSNYCNIGLTFDERTNRIIIVSVIDNLVKGAAGQAIQNFNIMNGFNQTTGLDQTPVYP